MIKSVSHNIPYYASDDSTARIGNCFKTEQDTRSWNLSSVRSITMYVILNYNR